ncbi:MAG: HEAT repeat domain-containing protein [Planctomycetota bacterium]
MAAPAIARMPPVVPLAPITLVLTLAVPHDAPAPLQDASDLAELSRQAMGDSPVDGRVFDDIGRLRTRMALNALLVCCDDGPAERRPPANHALRHFAGADGLEERALAALVETVFGDDATAYDRRAAARAMTAFGGAARGELERVLAECDDALACQWAIGGLVGVLGTRRAARDLESLLEHYRPPFSGSIELGGEVIGAFRDEASGERLRAVLRSEKAPPVVREMAALAVARQDGPEVDAALRRALRDPDPFVVVRAIDGLRARGTTEHATKIAALSRRPSPLVRRTAFRAMTSMRYGQPAFDKKLRRALASSDFALRWGAVAGLGDARDDASAAWIAERIADEHHAVRAVALECALERRLRPAIPVLIEELDAEEAPRRVACHAALVELTGEDFGRGAARWRAWWSGEGASFAVPPAAEARARIEARRAQADEGPTRATSPTSSFYGVTFPTDRVAFVLDLSGSMEIDDRIGRLKLQLRDALVGIPSSGRFNLIFFTADASSWGKRLVRMTPANRARADVVIDRLQADGWTNLHAGLALAFSDPDVRTILLLSDGEPSRGVTDTQAILRDVRAWNESRGVVVHTVSIGEIGSTGLMDGLAMLTGGEAATSF